LTRVAAHAQVVLAAVTDGDFDQFAMNTVGTIDFIKKNVIGIQTIECFHLFH
jgi:hypothetical protein